MTIHLEEFITLPINGEPQITNNNIAISQDLCKQETLDVIVNANGKFKKLTNFMDLKNLLALN